VHAFLEHSLVWLIDLLSHEALYGPAMDFDDLQVVVVLSIDIDRRQSPPLIDSYLLC
jgi:hypothetical protein